MNVIAPNTGLKDGLEKRLNGVSTLLHQVAKLRQIRKKTKSSESVRGPQAQVNEDDAPEVASTKIVHDFRVACRRAETALTVSGHRMHESELTRLRKQLNEIRHLCNSLRDHEVFTKWLKKQSKSTARRELLAELAQKIDREYSKVAQHARTLIKKRDFEGRIRAVLARSTNSEEGECIARNSEILASTLRQNSERPHLAIIESSVPPETVPVDRLNGHHKRQVDSMTADWSCGHDRHAAKWLFQALNEFVQNLPDNSAKLDALHAFRISTKRLRYGIEFMTEIEPRLHLTGPLDRLESIQEKLGNVHDAMVRQARLRWIRSSSKGNKALRKVAAEGLNQTRRDWNDWWQPAHCQQIIHQTVTEIGKLLN